MSVYRENAPPPCTGCNGSGEVSTWSGMGHDVDVCQRCGGTKVEPANDVGRRPIAPPDPVEIEE